MNLILLVDDDFVDPRRVRLTGRRLAFVRTVHRAAVGDVLRVGRLNGRIGHGAVARLDARELILEVGLDREPPPPVPLTLLLALPRPKVVRRVLRGVTAMGIKHIVLLNTWRVEKSFWSSPVLNPTPLRDALLLGLEQGGDTMLPTVDLRRRFKPFVEDELPALSEGTRGLLAHPAAVTPCPHGVGEPMTLAVGPEGGFIPYEVEQLCARGFEAVSLGGRPLLVEHAVPALLGRLVP
jgi:RsmE family RNA methyltransferase